MKNTIRIELNKDGEKLIIETELKDTISSMMKIPKICQIIKMFLDINDNEQKDVPIYVPWYYVISGKTYSIDNSNNEEEFRGNVS